MNETISQKHLERIVRDDEGAWFETYGRIHPKDRQQGLKRPKQNYLQRLIQRVIQRMRLLGLPVRIIEVKPRQAGSTTYFCASGYCKLRREPTAGVLIGGEYSQTKEGWGMYQTYQANDHFDWGNSGEVNTKEGRWSNGSRLRQETAQDVHAGIAGTYQLLHCTEVARWSMDGVANAAEVLTNILSCVPLVPDTAVYLESTAEGATGAFHARWLDAADTEQFLNGELTLSPGDFVRVFAAWFEFEDYTMRLTTEEKKQIEASLDVEKEFDGERQLIEKYGTIDEDGVQHLGKSVVEFDVWEQLAWRRYAIRKLCQRDKGKFDRDYPHSWQTAFQKSGQLRFNSTGLSVLRDRLPKPEAPCGIIEESPEKRLTFRVTEKNEAQVVIFEPPKPGFRYILTIDPMTGASQASGDDPDYHSVGVMRAGYWDHSGRWHRRCLAARIVPCQWDIDALEDPVWKLARFYGSRIGCMIAIEMNMDRGLTELLKKRGANLYQREIFNTQEQKKTKALGFLTTTRTRENLIEKVAQGIREWDTPGEGIDIGCPHAVEQCENFVRKRNGTSAAAAGYHDDDIIMLGLGIELEGHATTYFPERFGDGLPPDLRPNPNQQYPSAFS
jgi:hypothetical protein